MFFRLSPTHFMTFDNPIRVASFGDVPETPESSLEDMDLFADEVETALSPEASQVPQNQGTFFPLILSLISS